MEGVGVGGADVASYNVNGPGSASYRYYLFTITTSADDVDEVQRVRQNSNVLEGVPGGRGVPEKGWCSRI